jgi:hypothetical protein
MSTIPVGKQWSVRRMQPCFLARYVSKITKSGAIVGSITHSEYAQKILFSDPIWL